MLSDLVTMLAKSMCTFVHDQMLFRFAGPTRKIVNLGVTLASNASKYVSFTKARPRIGEAWGLQPWCQYLAP